MERSRRTYSLRGIFAHVQNLNCPNVASRLCEFPLILPV